MLNAGDWGFRVVEDEQTRRSRCGFWVDVAAAVTGLGGEFLFSFLLVSFLFFHFSFSGLVLFYIALLF